MLTCKLGRGVIDDVKEKEKGRKARKRASKERVESVRKKYTRRLLYYNTLFTSLL